jgi:O-antigen ligase
MNSLFGLRSIQLRILLARVALVLLGAGLIGFLSYRVDLLVDRDPTLIFAGLIGVAGLMLAARHGTFERGLAVMMLCAGFANFASLPTGRESRVVFSLAICMVLLIAWAYELLFSGKTGVKLKPSRINAPVLLFVAINIVAYAWSYLTRDALLQIWASFPFVQVAALVVNIGLPLLALLVSNKISDPVWVKRYMLFVIALGAINMLMRLANVRFLESFIGNGTNGIFGTWVAVIAYGVLLYDRKLPMPYKLALCVLLLAEGLFYFWRQRIWLSGWLPIAAGVLVLTFYKSKRLFAMLCVLGLIYAGLNSDVLYASVVQDNVDEGGLQRIDIWRMNLNHVSNHPLFGMGPAGYAIYNMTYHAEDARSTHNNYFDVLAQNGVFGLISFVVLAVMILWIGQKTRQQFAGAGDFREAFVNSTFAGFAAALVSMMLGDWVLPFAYNVTIMGFDHAVHTWLAAGLMLGLHQLGPGDQRETR